MIAREPADRHSDRGHSDPGHSDLGHSDLGPSSKDWAPGIPGRDEDFTPDKDRWSATHKGGKGDRDIEPEASAGSPPSVPNAEVQPGTAQEGKSWQSHRPDPDDKDDQLETALQDTFPTSDPPAVTQPGVTGWDAEEKPGEEAGGTGR
jgi:hypothetical protein